MAHFVLIRNQYGDIASAHTSLEQAQKDVLEYVQENWDVEELGAFPASDQAIDHYFDQHQERESYQIWNLNIVGEFPPPPQPDEVTLTPEEVHVVLSSLVLTSESAVSKDTGMSQVVAMRCMDSAYKKLKD